MIAQTKLALQKDRDSALWEIVGDDLDVVDGKTIFLGLDKKDKTALTIFSDYVGYLADGIIHVIDTLHPEAVLLGGGIANAGQRLLRPLREAVEKRGYSGMQFANVKIEIAKLGNQAGMYGAYALAKQSLSV